MNEKEKREYQELSFKGITLLSQDRHAEAEPYLLKALLLKEDAPEPELLSACAMCVGFQSYYPACRLMEMLCYIKLALKVIELNKMKVDEEYTPRAFARMITNVANGYWDSFVRAFRQGQVNDSELIEGSVQHVLTSLEYSTELNPSDLIHFKYIHKVCTQVAKLEAVYLRCDPTGTLLPVDMLRYVSEQAERASRAISAQP